MSKTDARDELRAKIEASDRRIKERTLADSAREVVEDAGKFAKAHPFTVIGGAIAAGLMIGLLTSPGRQLARNTAVGTARAVSNTAEGAKSAVGKAAKSRAASLGNILADAAIAYGIKLIDEALDRARTGQEALGEAGDSAKSKARDIRREASSLAGSAADKVRDIRSKVAR